MLITSNKGKVMFENNYVCSFFPKYTQELSLHKIATAAAEILHGTMHVLSIRYIFETFVFSL
jgi:hypothetical protein